MLSPNRIRNLIFTGFGIVISSGYRIKKLTCYRLTGNFFNITSKRVDELIALTSAANLRCRVLLYVRPHTDLSRIRNPIFGDFWRAVLHKVRPYGRQQRGFIAYLLRICSIFASGIAAVFSSECLVDHVYGDKKTAELGSAEFSLFRFGVAILLGNS